MQFQLTSPQGDEHTALDLLGILLVISTHVSVRRRTDALDVSTRIISDFNSRLRKETNIQTQKVNVFQVYFNSRLRKETNPVYDPDDPFRCLFQLTSP